MAAASEADFESLLDCGVARIERVAGGDIGESVRLHCDSGATYFAKQYPGGAPEMARAEAAGLDWIAQPHALRVPKVIAASHAASPILVLEWIEQRPPAKDFDISLGRGLAALHLAGAKNFGFETHNFIGSLPQRNGAHERWSDFFAQERIAPQAEMARRSGRIANDLDRDLQRLIETMDQHCGPEVEPARLHGDLWSGNLISDERGQPCLVDPAAYGGHAEVDLSMMKLFGGFGARVFDAYREAAPLSPGHEERTALWQLYPLLVHVNLFGGSYVDSVARVVRQFV